MAKKSINPFGKPISKLTLKEVVDADWSIISSLDEKQSRTFYNRIKKFAKVRVDRINKASEYSKAYQFNIPNGIPVIRGNSSRNEIQHNISVVKGFMEHPTSTLKGIKADRKKTSARIFGEDKKGKPLYTFENKDEEKRFWRAYSEFMHQNPSYVFQSTRIQQHIAQETFWKTRDFTQGDFNSLLQKLTMDEFGDKWDNMEDFL